MTSSLSVLFSKLNAFVFPNRICLKPWFAFFLSTFGEERSCFFSDMLGESMLHNEAETAGAPRIFSPVNGSMPSAVGSISIFAGFNQKGSFLVSQVGWSKMNLFFVKSPTSIFTIFAG